MSTVYLILKDNIMYYPPVLSIINVLLELKYRVVHIGNYTDKEQKKQLEERGAIFKSTIKLDDNVSLLKKLAMKLEFKRQVTSYLEIETISKEDYVWLFHTETLCLLNDLVDRYRVVFHPLEFTQPVASWKYKVLTPSLNLAATVKKTAKVVCCEYNRAQITKGMFALEQMPYVLPNKMYMANDELTDIPEDVQDLVNPILSKVEGKKIILYQGVFLDKERRLEEFCEAVKEMSDEYVLIAMGKGSSYYESLKDKYQSEKILFIPFIRPPYHLLVTKAASIGVLSYFPDSTSISSVINPLYCAPNKIFEYARYGTPMISNDIPGLYYIFMQYECGEVVRHPMTTTGIKATIEKIYTDYDKYASGALRYYRSVDIEEIIKSVLSDK